MPVLAERQSLPLKGPHMRKRIVTVLLTSLLCGACATHSPRDVVREHCFAASDQNPDAAAVGFASIQESGDVLRPTTSVQHVAYPFPRVDNTPCTLTSPPTLPHDSRHHWVFDDDRLPIRGPLCGDSSEFGDLLGQTEGAPYRTLNASSSP